jgi:hypothetical protein
VLVCPDRATFERAFGSEETQMLLNGLGHDWRRKIELGLYCV